MKIAVVLGTRPEIIKMAPVISYILEQEDECLIIHTGQHYDTQMSRQFFIDLDLPIPDYNIGIGSKSALKQISIIIDELEDILESECVDIVLVQGDTNTVLAGAVASNKLKIPVGHVESGLRSFDKDMPEEINRILADDSSMLYFVPTNETGINLLNEAVDHDRIYVTGNTIVDACNRHKEIALKKSRLKDELLFDDYIALTMHRAENVDDNQRLSQIVDAILDLEYNIVFPVHPHTKKSLVDAGLYESLVEAENIQITKPLGYLDFLYLLCGSRVILTDSGGVQEEAVTLNIPCVTLRYSTERPETVSCGANILAGSTSVDIKKNITQILEDEIVYESMSNAVNPYGDGESSKKIYDVIKSYHDRGLLRIRKLNDITKFNGYHLYSISSDVTVREYEKTNRNSTIQQVFNSDGESEFITDDLELKNKTIIVKEFEVN